MCFLFPCLLSRQLLQGGGSQGCLNLREQQRRRVSRLFLLLAARQSFGLGGGGSQVRREAALMGLSLILILYSGLSEGRAAFKCFSEVLCVRKRLNGSEGPDAASGSVALWVM